MLLAWASQAQAAATGAAATATVSGGVITGFTVSSGGSGYASAPTIFITDSGGGTGASATATVSGGAVTVISVTAGGSGYTDSTTSVIILPSSSDLDSAPTTTPTLPADVSTPDTSSLPDAPTTSPSSGIKFFSLSTRAGIYGYPIPGSLTIKGDGSKKVLFRVKGPSMGFGGPKVENPKIKLLSKASGSWSTLFEVNDFGDHESSATYADRATGNSLEPLAVVSLVAGTYSCQFFEENSGTGNGNMEIYGFEDDDTAAYFSSLSTRGYVSSYPMAGSLTLKGEGTAKVMFRVKGPSMSFGGEKLPNPKIKILTKVDGVWSTVVESNDYGDHESASEYAERATGNSLEPMIVLSLGEGTYSCQVFSEVDGEEGNANLEVYLVD